MLRPLSWATLSVSVRALVLLGTVTIVATALDLPAVSASASVTALLVPLTILTRRSFHPGSAVTPILATFTLFWLVMLVAIETLSAFSLLGSRVAWSGILLGFAIVLQVASARWHREAKGGGCLDLIPARSMQAEPWAILAVPVALTLGALFAQSAYLDTFTGINHTDSQEFYTPRAVRYLQDGNLWTYSTFNDFRPHLHQTISAYLLLFSGSESSIILLSALFGGFVGLTLFDLSRLTRVPVSLSLLVGLSPMAVPIFNLHLGTSHFDVHTALFIALAIYFLVIAGRVSDARYFVPAAAATSLALAIKPTFFFAAPGLLVIWIGALIRLTRSQPWRTIARVMLVATLIVALGGVHYLRNAWTQGFLITPDRPEYGQSDLSTPRQVFEQFTLSALASTTILLTPSIIVRGDLASAVEATFRSTNESLGIFLPNAALTDVPGRSWPDILSHLRTPFESDKAGFGAVLPLAVAPAAAFAIFDAVRRRRLFTLPMAILAYAGLYLIAISLGLRFTTSIMRYLIELAVPLLVLVPLLMVRLPIVVGMLYLAVVSGFLLVDAYQALQQNVQRPLGRVTVVPREDQYPTFVAPESFTYFEGARMLDRKYPADEWPQIYVVRSGATPWAGLDYPFLDPQARRRVTYWFGNLDTDRPTWPGPFLVLAPDVAEILDSRFGEQVVLDRLSDQVWLGLPRDQLRLLWSVEATDGTKPSAVRLRAVHNPDRYRQPVFRFSTVDMRTGALVSILRGFARDARFTLPSTSLSRVLYLQVEVRESGSSSTDEQLRVPERRMMER